jgi:hypothetical protein
MQLFDKFGTLIRNGHTIELGDLSANMLHAAPLFIVEETFDSAVSYTVSINNTSLKFFEIEHDLTDDVNYIKLLDDSEKTFLMTYNTVHLVFKPASAGEYKFTVNIKFDTGQEYLFYITGAAVAIDERLSIMMSNLGQDYLTAFNDALLLTDNRQDLIDNILQNEKMREWIVHRDDIDSKLGTYAGIYAALNWLGYSDYVQIYEVLRNTAGESLLIKLEEDVAKYSQTFFRTNLLALVYHYNHFTDKYVNNVRCKSLPIIELTDTLPDQDTLKKVDNLIDVMEEVFLPEHIHFVEYSFTIFAAYISMTLLGVQHQLVQSAYPEMTGAIIVAKDISTVGSVYESITYDNVYKPTAFIRPHSIMLNESQLTQQYKNANDVFEIAQVAIDDTYLNAQDYINWYITEHGTMPQYIFVNNHL